MNVRNASNRLQVEHRTAELFGGDVVPERLQSTASPSVMAAINSLRRSDFSAVIPGLCRAHLNPVTCRGCAKL